ncbi:unnamed protein product, partial [Porites lobata]
MQFYLISTPLARCSKKITHATPSSDLHLKAPNSEFLKSSPPLTLFLNCKQPFSLVGTYACLELELKDDGQVEAFLKNLVVNYMTALERNLDIRSQEAAPVAHRINFQQIVDAAQTCLTQPMSNEVVERAASAVKRVKTRLRSRLKNDTMASLLHISVNGPNHDTEECREMLTEATKVWRKTHFRNLPSPKKLPMVEFPDDLQASRTEAQEDGEVTVETELDAQVQVVAQAVASNADLCHDTLDAMDMGDVEFGIDSDF